MPCEKTVILDHHISSMSFRIYPLSVLQAVENTPKSTSAASMQEVSPNSFITFSVANLRIIFLNFSLPEAAVLCKEGMAFTPEGHCQARKSFMRPVSMLLSS